MVFSVLALLQLGGAMPVAGGLYVYGTRLVHPVLGFITIWLVIPFIWAGLLFTSIGFAQFSNVLIPTALPEPVLVIAVLAAFLLLNLRGITLVTGAQLVMVVGIMIGFAALIVPGLFSIEAANYTPMFPEGIPPFLLAVVAMYVPFQGYFMIVELGEELKDPVRNIPRVLMYGMGLAVLLSMLLVIVFVGLDRYDVLGAYGEEGGGGLARAAGDYLPTGVSAVVVIAAILGAFSTVNAVMTSYSRTSNSFGSRKNCDTPMRRSLKRFCTSSGWVRRNLA
jgi:APA family basic amino acid/polyamine antiporter